MYFCMYLFVYLIIYLILRAAGATRDDRLIRTPTLGVQH